MQQKIKRIFSDSLFSIFGLILMNVIVQFAVYPTWNRVLGSEAYGNILYNISLINIAAISIGTSCSYVRMKASATEPTMNTPYLAYLGLSSALMVPFVALLKLTGLIRLDLVETILYAAVMCLTMWRCYCDVEYRLSLNYKGFFVYYAAIGAGYLLGILLFKLTNLWPLALLPGELAGVGLVLLRGRVLRRDIPANRENCLPVWHMILVLLGSEILSTVVFNGDRLLLQWLDSAAVTTYYLASLLGKTVSLITTPLNGVIIGYLARYKGGITRRLVGIVALAALGIIAVGTLCCTIASHIIIPILYPGNYADAKPLFIVANLSQVIYFVANMVTVVLIRFGKLRHNLYVNVAYMLVFCLCCIPAAALKGLVGFCYALLFTCAARLGTALWLCLRGVEPEKESVS